MKKIYQTPTTLIVKVKATRMMAGSPEGFKGGLNSAPTGTNGNGSNALSRGGGSLWDDDDYDE